MASDNRSIVIELRVANGDGTSDAEQKTNENKENNKAKSLGAVILTESWQYAKQAITQVANYELSKNIRLTENYKMEMQVQNAMTGINKAVSFGSALISGAIAGSYTGSPIGIAVGVGLAAVGWTATEGIGIYQRFEQAGISLAQGNLQSGYGMSRLGLIDGGRGTLN